MIIATLRVLHILNHHQAWAPKGVALTGPGNPPQYDYRGTPDCFHNFFVKMTVLDVESAGRELRSAIARLPFHMQAPHIVAQIRMLEVL